jgi:hypothetical protein
MLHDGSLNISYEQMRSVVVEALRGGSGTQFANLREQLPAVAKQMGLVTEPEQLPGGRRVVYSGGGRLGDRLSDRDYGRRQSIVWDLIIEGIVRPGLGDGNNAGSRSSTSRSGPSRLSPKPRRHRMTRTDISRVFRRRCPPLIRSSSPT